MNRILVLVEGETEYEFVDKLLAPYLLGNLIALIPTIVETKKVIGKKSHKGGGDFSKIRADILSLLNDSNAVAVTTLFDFYGFPVTPDITETDYCNVNQLEQAIAQIISNNRFKPYLQLHEFEAFLFIAPELTAKVALKKEATEKIQQHRSQFNHVEEINLDVETAPSKRLIATIGNFNKPRIGAQVTQELGIAKLINECPKFAIWISWMQSFECLA